MAFITNAAKYLLEESPSLLAEIGMLPLIRSPEWAEFVADLPNFVGPDAALVASRNKERMELEDLLAKGNFRHSLGRRDLEIYGDSDDEVSPDQVRGFKSGYFTTEAGKVKFAVVRTPEVGLPVRFRNELAGYNLHYASAFTNDFPVTVVRPYAASDFGEALIQERFGRTLDRQLTVRDFRHYDQTESYSGNDFPRSPTFENILGNHEPFYDLMEQTVAERIALFGDNDGFARNIGIKVKPGEVRVANIDLDHRAFQDDQIYPPGMHQFAGQRICDPTLFKLDHFLGKFDSPLGHRFMRELNLNQTESENSFNRAKLLLRTRRFPG